MIGTYPHDIINVSDNSVITETGTFNKGPVFLQPFVSSKGIDSEIVEYNSPIKFKNEFGAPDMRLHGQAYYNALAAIQNGAIVKGCRITAKNATYSNILIKLVLKNVTEQAKNPEGKPLYISETDGETIIAEGNKPLMVEKMKVKLEAEYFDNLTDINEDLEIKMRSKYSDKNDTFVYPLYLFVSKGRGTYGDNFRLRLTPNKAYDKNSNYRNYTFELLSNEEGLKKIEIPLNVTANPYGKNQFSNRSDYIEDVLRRNVFPVTIYAVDDYYYEIAQKLLPVIHKTNQKVTADDVDILFLLDKKTGETYHNIEIEEDSINLSQYEGYPLQGGDDGDFKRSNPERFTAIYQRYKDFYLGKIDHSVTDIKTHIFHVALDANYPIEVKNAMRSLNITRKGDHATMLDAGILHTVLDAKTWARDEMVVDDSNVSIYMHNFLTPDMYTGKDILVTETYIIANELPKFMLERGNSAYEPFAGIDIELNKYIIEGSLKPLIAEEDKQELYDLRLNYIERENNKYVFGTQVTTQKKWSALTDLNNSFILHEIIRDVRDLAPHLRYKPNETEEDMKELNRRLNARIEPYEDYKVKKCVGKIIKNNNPDDYKTLLTNIAVVFKSYSTVNEITIEINRK